MQEVEISCFGYMAVNSTDMRGVIIRVCFRGESVIVKHLKRNRAYNCRGWQLNLSDVVWIKGKPESLGFVSTSSHAIVINVISQIERVDARTISLVKKGSTLFQRLWWCFELISQAAL